MTRRTIRRDPVERVAEKIKRRLANTSVMPRSLLLKSITAKDRQHLDAALRLLLDAGEVEATPIVVGHSFRLATPPAVVLEQADTALRTSLERAEGVRRA